jgi:YVTN family beta-propeller protein
MKSFIPILISAIALAACSPSTSDTKDGSGRTVLIVNQGGFNRGEATLSELRVESGTVRGDVFSEKNGRPLGDVAQSLTEFGDRLFIVVNNSHKIEVVAKSDYRSVGTIAIPGNASPRYMAVSSGNHGYVTNLYSNNVMKVDLSTLSVIKQIDVGMGSEGIVISNDTAFVAKNLASDFSSGHQIALIRTGNDAVIQTWETCVGPTQLAVIGSHLVVSCTGTWGENDGEVVVHNRSTGAIVRRIALNAYAGGFAKAEGNVIYALANGVKRVDVGSGSVTPITARSFYAIGYDGESLWLADALNYAQAGRLIRASSTGAAIDSFTVGIVPGYIHMDEN